jgi:hypothetical protein
MRKSHRCPLIVLFSLCISGCAGHFVVKPTTPDSAISGFRYYLPAPYLLVTNTKLVEEGPATSKQQPTSSGGSPENGSTPDGSHAKSEQMGGTSPSAQSIAPVTVALIWLPDTERPYSITSSGGAIGTFKGGFQLTNGWMLTNVSEESDAKVAETLTAVSGLIGSALSPGAAKPKSTEGETTPSQPFFYLFKIDLSKRELTRIDTSALNSTLSGAVHAASDPRK